MIKTCCGLCAAMVVAACEGDGRVAQRALPESELIDASSIARDPSTALDAGSVAFPGDAGVMGGEAGKGDAALDDAGAPGGGSAPDAALGDAGPPGGDTSPDAALDDGGVPDAALDGGPGSVLLDGDLDGDVTLRAGVRYELHGFVFVRSGTLTLEPGTTVYARGDGGLVVTPSARLVALGTASQPIVFTSGAEGARAPGDWGGVVLLGSAPIDAPGGRARLPALPEFSDAAFGGDAPSHDCGQLSHVRFEFAGLRREHGAGLPALTLAACGTDTEVDSVQLHRTRSDGLGLLGGAVRVTRALCSFAGEDCFGIARGYHGALQFVIARQGGDGLGHTALNVRGDLARDEAAPRTYPVVWNATLVGSDAEPGEAGKYQEAVRVSGGAALALHDALVLHFADSLVDVVGPESEAQASAGAVAVSHTLWFDNAGRDGPRASDGTPGALDEETFFTRPELANASGDPALSAPLDDRAPAFTPRENSPALDPAAGATPPDGFAPATFRGALSRDDWTAGWTQFPTE